MISPDNDRRQFVSGFTGSSGTAVVTDKRAVLWTDGRYYLQANLQLDCQWTLMKSGDDEVRNFTSNVNFVRPQNRMWS